MFRDQLGDWLEMQRRNSRKWFLVLLVGLGLLVLLNFVIHPTSNDEGGHGGGHGEAVESAGHGDTGHGEADTHAAEGHGEEAEAAGHGDAGHGEAAQAEGLVVTGEVHHTPFMQVDHPHFVIDVWPGFWAVFGFGVAVAMTLVLKKFIFLLIGKAEDFYERD